MLSELELQNLMYCAGIPAYDKSSKELCNQIISSKIKEIFNLIIDIDNPKIITEAHIYSALEMLGNPYLEHGNLLKCSNIE